MEKTKKVLSKKYGQKDLRRLMLDLKKNAESTKESTERVNSPIAKYDSLGNLTCVICKSTVKSAIVWKVHIHSKQHKENVKTAKILSDKLLSIPTNANKVEPQSSVASVQENKVRGKNDEKKPLDVPHKVGQSNLCSEVLQQKTNDETTPAPDSNLPEHFFDDPMTDALVRNVDYKDPLDNEWEKFQREIKEESTMSNVIIASEQENSASLRLLEELDEQMERWTRVVDLEMRTEQAIKKRKKKHEKKEPPPAEQHSSEDDNDEFNEYCNWRSKKFYNQ